MAANLNRVFLMGNLTRDPELNYTPQGTAVGKFSIAVNRQYKGSDGELKKQTDFFNIVAWGKTGEICKKYLSKGRPVFVEGRLQNRSYETQDKQKRTVTEIIADNVQFLGSSMGGGGRPEEGPSASDDSNAGGYHETDSAPFPGNDEVPF